MQLEKILQSQGFGSRKECRALIRDERVTVNGAVIRDPSTNLPTDDLVFAVDDQPWRYRAQAYVLLHKPAGHECSRVPTFHPSVFTLLPPQLALRDVQCVGRLDQDSTGLLLLSDDGQFIHRWSSGKKQVPKCYRIETADPVSEADAARLLAGVQLEDEPAPVLARAVVLDGSHQLRMTITEGKYHQVKRMIGALGNRVTRLHRESVGGLSLPADLPEGQWRWLEAADLAQLAAYD